jgi:hypothetical protein
MQIYVIFIGSAGDQIGERGIGYFSMEMEMITMN